MTLFAIVEAWSPAQFVVICLIADTVSFRALLVVFMSSASIIRFLATSIVGLISSSSFYISSMSAEPDALLGAWMIDVISPFVIIM